MPRLLVNGVLSGAVWGLIAAAVFLSMFRGVIPAPGEVGGPIGIVLVVLYLPFLVAAALEAAAGRPSPSFAEIVGVTLASGAGLGIVLIAGMAMVRGLAKAARPRN